ncbi:hypothetical protein SDC9_132372 [bioreactor metagenome]|uniref:Uncharacterized protein n=1 Tax=bioreactor metagenome TaxID=1076179 RepID=A0A645D7H3_9ZZZZ
MPRAASGAAVCTASVADLRLRLRDTVLQIRTVEIRCGTTLQARRHLFRVCAIEQQGGCRGELQLLDQFAMRGHDALPVAHRIAR